MLNQPALNNVWSEPAIAFAVPAEIVKAKPKSRVRNLAEVKHLRARGYHLMDPDSIVDVRFTAVWPARHRVWVPDRSTRVVRWSCDDGSSGTSPLSAEDRAEVEMEMNWLLADGGLPPRPPGRVWLVELPQQRKSLYNYQISLQRRADQAGVSDDEYGRPEWVAFMRGAIADDFATSLA